MEFGTVTDEELAGVDFTLPADPQITLNTLAAAKNDAPLQVHDRRDAGGDCRPHPTRPALHLARARDPGAGLRHVCPACGLYA